MSHLIPCLSCRRHLRVTEVRCPFCGVALSPEQRASACPRLPGRRLGRAALFAFGATMMGAAACSDPEGGGKDAGNPPVADGSAGSGGSGGGSGGTGGQGGSGGSGTGGQDGGRDASSDGGAAGRDGATEAGSGGTGGGVAPAYGIAPLYGLPPSNDAN